MDLNLENLRIRKETIWLVIGFCLGVMFMWYIVFPHALEEYNIRCFSNIAEITVQNATTTFNPAVFGR